MAATVSPRWWPWVFVLMLALSCGHRKGPKGPPAPLDLRPPIFHATITYEDWAPSDRPWEHAPTTEELAATATRVAERCLAFWGQRGRPPGMPPPGEDAWLKAIIAKSCTTSADTPLGGGVVRLKGWSCTAGDYTGRESLLAAWRHAICCHGICGFGSGGNADHERCAEVCE